MKEEWKYVPEQYIPITGVLYQVSSLGRVRKKVYLQNGKLSSWIKIRGSKSDGYKAISIKKGNGKHYKPTIHRLVGFAFLPNPENKPQINHKNRVKHDNRVENLEWCTNRENAIHALNTEKPTRKKKIKL